MKLEYHPLANLFPLIEGAQYAEFLSDIRQNGLIEPIILFEGKILDGRNRYLATKEAGVKQRFVTFNHGDPLAFVVSKNLRRRQLKDSQRALIAARLSTMKQGRRTDLSRKNGELSVSEAAQLLNVKERSVVSAKLVEKQGTEKIKSLVANGSLSVSAAARVTHLSAERQDALALGGATAVVAEARRADGKSAKAGRNEYATLWPLVDEIIAGLEQRRLDVADIAARKITRAIAAITTARREK